MSGKDERERLVESVISKAKRVSELAAEYWRTSGSESIYLEDKLDAAEEELKEARDKVLAALREREPREVLPPVFRQELSEGFCWTVQWDPKEEAWALGAINPRTGEHVFHSHLAEPQPEREPDDLTGVLQALKVLSSWSREGAVVIGFWGPEGRGYAVKPGSDPFWSNQKYYQTLREAVEAACVDIGKHSDAFVARLEEALGTPPQDQEA